MCCIHAGQSIPHAAALQQVPESMLMEMACRPARRREAVLAASHIRSQDVTSTMLVSSAGEPCHRRRSPSPGAPAVTPDKHAGEQAVLCMKRR